MSWHILPRGELLGRLTGGHSRPELFHVCPQTGFNHQRMKVRRMQPRGKDVVEEESPESGDGGDESGSGEL